MTSIVIGVVLVIFGAIYLRKPTLFRRGFWMTTSLAIRFMSEENYLKYMRGLGVVYIVLGLGFIVWGAYSERLN